MAVLSFAMTATRENIVTQALNGHYTAQHSDYVDVWTSPAGHGWTREKALENLAIDEAYQGQHGSIRDQYPEDFADEGSK